MIKKLFNTANFKRSKTYFLEAATLFLVLLVIDYLFMQNQTLNQLFPHPFWIPVVLLSAQYGSSGGVIAAIIALALYLVLGLPVQNVDKDYYEYLIDVWKQPALWTLTAIILGEIGTRHINEKIYLKEHMVMFKKQRRTIANYCRQMEHNIDGLERQLATIEERSADHLIGQLAAINALQYEQFEVELPPLMEEIFGPIDFALHQFGKTASSLVLAHGNSIGQRGGNRHERSATLSPKLRQQFEWDPSGYSVLALSNKKPGFDQLLFAVPLLVSGKERVLGALVVYQLPALAINEKSFYLLQLLGRELAGKLAASDLDLLEEALITRESA